MEQAEALDALPTAARGCTFRALERILQPMDVASFIVEYYERQALHVARHCPSYFNDLYSIAMFEHGIFVASQFAQHLILVTSADGTNPHLNELRREHWRLAEGANPPAASHNSHDSALHPRKLAEAFAGGSTLILNAAAALAPSLSELCRALELDLGFKVGANAYLTPPSAQGFRLHLDTHDTVILQIEGSKYWSIYEEERHLPLTGEVNLLNGEHKPHTTLLLHPGDTLYLPRGVPHEAQATDSRSLHVTLGWYQPRLSDIIVTAVQEAARGNLTFRRGVRPGWARDAAMKQELIEDLSSFIDAIQSSDCIATAVDATARQVVLDGQGEATEFLSDPDSLASLDDSSLIVMRTDVSYEIRDYLFYLEVVIWGRLLTLPASYATAIEQIRQKATALRDLKGIAPDERRKFAAQLVTIGAARVEV